MGKRGRKKTRSGSALLPSPSPSAPLILIRGGERITEEEYARRYQAAWEDEGEAARRQRHLATFYVPMATLRRAMPPLR